MSLFGGSDDDENEQDERVTLPFEVTTRLIEKEVKEANDNIEILNHEYDWSVYKLPLPEEGQVPSLNQLREIDDDLHRLYEKVSSRRPENAAERRRIIRARQSVQELIDFYLFFDQISKPAEPSSPDSDEDDGGVPNAV